MPLELDIIGPIGGTPPYIFYICDENGNNCEETQIIDDSITLSPFFQTANTLMFKTIDSFGCEFDTIINLTTIICDICEPPCELSFDSYSSNTIGQLVVGNITGDCGDITSYVIYWYNSNEEIQLISGFGPLIPGYLTYSVTHPLTGNASPPIPADIYTPILQAIVINGVTYTLTGLSGTTEANLDCLTSISVTVDPYNCENCTEVGHYKCRKTYTTTPGSIVPADTLAITFELDSSTTYFAYAFKGDTIPDSLKITFINQDGANYNHPILVEYITVGQSIIEDSDLGLGILPKRIKTGDANEYYAKPLNLSNFTINNGDYLIIEVIPNTGITQTSWDLYFTCLDSFDCNSCLETNIPFKISASTISFSNSNCNVGTFNAKFIGCPQYYNEDIFKFMHSVNNPLLDTKYPFNNNPKSDYFGLEGGTYGVNITNNMVCALTNLGDNTQTCELTFNTITFTKVGPIITITCSDINDRDSYYDSYLFVYNLTGWQPTPPLPTSLNYYRYIIFKYLQPLVSTSTCGDNQYNIIEYSIHPSSTVTIGGSLGAYTMTINMSTITNQIVSACTNCSQIASLVVYYVNNSVNYANNTYTTNNGLKYNIPFIRYAKVVSYQNNLSSGLGPAYLFIPNYSNETLTYSGSPLTIIPSLTATTCDFNWMIFNPIILNGREVQYYNQSFKNYNVILTDINNPTYFNIRVNNTIIYEVNSTYPSGNIIDAYYFV